MSTAASTNPNQVTLRLTLDVTYEDTEYGVGQAKIEQLGRELLQELVNTAMNRGMVTSDSFLEVAEHQVKIERLEAQPA